MSPLWWLTSMPLMSGSTCRQHRVGVGCAGSSRRRRSGRVGLGDADAGSREEVVGVVAAVAERADSVPPGGRRLRRCGGGVGRRRCGGLERRLGRRCRFGAGRPGRVAGRARPAEAVGARLAADTRPGRRQRGSRAARLGAGHEDHDHRQRLGQRDDAWDGHGDRSRVPAPADSRRRRTLRAPTPEASVAKGRRPRRAASTDRSTYPGGSVSLRLGGTASVPGAGVRRWRGLAGGGGPAVARPRAGAAVRRPRWEGGRPGARTMRAPGPGADGMGRPVGLCVTSAAGAYGVEDCSGGPAEPRRRSLLAGPMVAAA